MDTLQVENVLRADCKLSLAFDGVYASDCLPLYCGAGNDTAMVMNLDPSTLGGSHWVCLYIAQGRGEYFDSYGLAPPLEDFVRFLDRNTTSSSGRGGWTYNTQELQSLDTEVCGHYCIWFLSERARGRSMQDIVRQFSNSDTQRNDVMVRRQVESRFGQIVVNAQIRRRSGGGGGGGGGGESSSKCVQCCCARAAVQCRGGGGGV
jgi:hypothetical protein